MDLATIERLSALGPCDDERRTDLPALDEAGFCLALVVRPISSGDFKDLRLASVGVSFPERLSERISARTPGRIASPACVRPSRDLIVGIGRLLSASLAMPPEQLYPSVRHCPVLGVQSSPSRRGAASADVFEIQVENAGGCRPFIRASMLRRCGVDVVALTGRPDGAQNVAVADGA